MKLHSLISAVVLGMAAHVQAQEKPVPSPLLGAAGAPQTVPAPKTAAKAGNPESGISFVEDAPITPPDSAKINVILTANSLRDNFAEIEKHLGSLTVAKGAPKPVMPNMIFSEDAREAAMSGSLRVQGVSPVQALALACAAAGCSMEPIFAPAEETVSPGKTQQIIGYRIVREPAKALISMTNQKQFTELVEVDAKIKSAIAAAAAKYQSLREQYSQNHPSVIAAEKNLVQLRRSLEAATKRKKAESEQKIPSIVRGRLLDKDGRPLGKKVLSFVVKDSTTLLTDGPTSDDGTFQFELPVDQEWQAVLRENEKSPGLRSEAMMTPIADRTSADPNYELVLRVDGARLETSLKPLMFNFTGPILGGIGLALSKQDEGVVVKEILPGSPAAANPVIKPGQRILSVAEDGKPTVDTTNIAMENLVALLRGAPGTSVTVTFGSGSEKDAAKHTVTLVRAKLIPLKSADELIHETYENNQIGFPVLTPADPSPLPKVNVMSGSDLMAPAVPGSGIGWVKPLGESAYLNSGMALPADNNRQIVRVYALRGILGDGKDYGRKQEACENLINETLQQAGVDKTKEPPRLSFHQDSRVLVVKATAAQHEMIGQVIKALKENELQPVQTPDSLKEKPSELTPEVIKPNK